MARALEGPSLLRISQYWTITAANPTKKRRRISHKGKTGVIMICLKLIGSVGP
jgi:hypothetical protein